MARTLSTGGAPRERDGEDDRGTRRACAPSRRRGGARDPRALGGRGRRHGAWARRIACTFAIGGLALSLKGRSRMTAALSVHHPLAELSRRRFRMTGRRILDREVGPRQGRQLRHERHSSGPSSTRLTSSATPCGTTGWARVTRDGRRAARAPGSRWPPCERVRVRLPDDVPTHAPVGLLVRCRLARLGPRALPVGPGRGSSRSGPSGTSRSRRVWLRPRRHEMREDPAPDAGRSSTRRAEPAVGQGQRDPEASPTRSFTISPMSITDGTRGSLELRVTLSNSRFSAACWAR